MIGTRFVSHKNKKNAGFPVNIIPFFYCNDSAGEHPTQRLRSPLAPRARTPIKTITNDMTSEQTWRGGTHYLASAPSGAAPAIHFPAFFRRDNNRPPSAVGRTVARQCDRCTVTCPVPANRRPGSVGLHFFFFFSSMRRTFSKSRYRAISCDRHPVTNPYVNPEIGVDSPEHILKYLSTLLNFNNCLQFCD